MRLEEDVKRSSAQHKRFERELNSIKPKLLWLYRKRDRCQWLLVRKGVSQAALQKLLQVPSPSPTYVIRLDCLSSVQMHLSDYE